MTVFVPSRGAVSGVLGSYYNYDFVVPVVSDLQRQRNIEICDG